MQIAPDPNSMAEGRDHKAHPANQEIQSHEARGYKISTGDNSSTYQQESMEPMSEDISSAAYPTSSSKSFDPRLYESASDY